VILIQQLNFTFENGQVDNSLGWFSSGYIERVFFLAIRQKTSKTMLFAYSFFHVLFFFLAQNVKKTSKRLRCEKWYWMYGTAVLVALLWTFSVYLLYLFINFFFPFFNYFTVIFFTWHFFIYFTASIICIFFLLFVGSYLFCI
jgi:hypothetical protein